MGKAPAFQFYPGDWFREPGLKVVDLSVRGAWAELLMNMWDCEPQGVFEASVFGYANLWRTTIENAGFIIQELYLNKIADVEFDKTETAVWVKNVHEMSTENPHPVPEMSRAKIMYVKITNRRMLKEWNIKEYERLKKQKQRDVKKGKRDKKEVSPKCPPKVPLLSSSSSSVSSLDLKRSQLEASSKGSNHYSEKVGGYFEKIVEFCNVLSTTKTEGGKRENLHMWVQQKINKQGHPKAIHDSLTWVYEQVRAGEKFRSFIGVAETVFKKANPKYNEQDSTVECDAFKEMWIPDNIKAITAGIGKGMSN